MRPTDSVCTHSQHGGGFYCELNPYPGRSATLYHLSLVGIRKIQKTFIVLLNKMNKTGDENVTYRFSFQQQENKLQLSMLCTSSTSGSAFVKQRDK